MTKKKRKPGRPKGSKTKKRGPGRPPNPKKAGAATKAKAPKKALSKSPMTKAAKAPVDLVAGKFVITVFGALLLRGDGSALFNTPRFSNDHALDFTEFQVFDSKPDAVVALRGLREKYGAVPPPPPPKVEAAAHPEVDLSFLDEKPAGSTPPVEEAFADRVPELSERDHAVEVALGLHPSADGADHVTEAGAPDGALVAALLAAEVEPAKAYFATSYAIAEGNALSKRVTWKEKAVSLSAAVKAVKVKLDEQVGQFLGQLKGFDTKVAVKRKELLADVNDAGKIRDDFLRLAKTYA